MHDVVIQVLTFILGLLIGSFLNVCIWRLPREESIIRPGSHCLACSTVLGAWDLVPVLSWIFLRGRCDLLLRYIKFGLTQVHGIAKIKLAKEVVRCEINRKGDCNQK